MSIPTKHQVIEKDGVPLYVLVPYDEWVATSKRIKKNSAKTYLPQAVVEKTAVDGKSLVRAWREYKHMSQKDVAERLGITQAAYCQLEKSEGTMRGSTIRKIAAALDVTEEQLILE
jgi:DNA-binding XRE family transcriptional regulator